MKFRNRWHLIQLPAVGPAWANEQEFTVLKKSVMELSKTLFITLSEVYF